jgi:hypothetical protein
VLSYTVLDGVVRVDEATDFHVELPPAVDVPASGTLLDQQELSQLETDT